MPKRSNKPAATRQLRISDQIQRDLSELIQFQLKDPQLHKSAGLITISEVQVTADYAHAKIYFTVLHDTPEVIATATQILQKAAGFFRKELAQRLSIYSMPELHFVYDHSVARALHMSQLIDRANADQH